VDGQENSKFAFNLSLVNVLSFAAMFVPNGILSCANQEYVLLRTYSSLLAIQTFLVAIWHYL
jgi:hypothetical protein